LSGVVRGRVEVVPWRAEWPELFAAERSRLASVFDRPQDRIEHVGSTAVAGLTAKPIVDVMVGVGHLADVDARVGVLEAMGYQYVPEYEAELPDRRYFRRPHRPPCSFHLHCVVLGGPFWVTHLAFRDHLRAHPDLAREYGRLKRDLAGRHPFDRRAYLEGKAPFIRRVLDEALA
jgi:GrpB-like predicted nucleotidyltransferase (UPF0157 family)